MLYEDLKLKLHYSYSQKDKGFRKEFRIYDVNTGKPIVAVVINAPAKIKKGR